MKKSSKKKVIRGTNSSSGKVTKIIHESTKEIKIEKALLENFVALQKVMLTLSSKFDGLSGQISKLLELFEMSAKSLAQKDFESLEFQSKDIKKVMEKLDNLTQQAGLIGRGLALIHETNSEKLIPGAMPAPATMPQNLNQPLPMTKPVQTNNSITETGQSYEKSRLSRMSENK